MKTVLATSLRLALLAPVLACGLSPLVQAQTFLFETPIPNMPSDVSVTPDGLVAIVRASERWDGVSTVQPDAISAWDMNTGSRINISSPPTGFGEGENQGFLLTTGPAPLAKPDAVHFSDLVQTTNSRAIAIGSRRSVDNLTTVDGTTFVDILLLDTSNDPIAVSVRAHWTLADPTPTLPNPERRKAGHAHDVAITPNGATDHCVT